MTQADNQPPESQAEDSRKLRRVVVATSAGTIFEAYDFILFGTLAPVIMTVVTIMILAFFNAGNERPGFTCS